MSVLFDCQVGPEPFNRAMLLNVGFVEAMRQGPNQPNQTYKPNQLNRTIMKVIQTYDYHNIQVLNPN
jgi:hypothetical protein